MIFQVYINSSHIFLNRLRSNRASFMNVVKVLRDFYYKFSFISFIPKPTKRVFMKFSSQSKVFKMAVFMVKWENLVIKSLRAL